MKIDHCFSLRAIRCAEEYMRLSPRWPRLSWLCWAPSVLSYAASSDAIEIPWKIGEPTAQHLAADGHYGGDEHLASFDYDANSSNSLKPHFYYGLNYAPVEGGFGYFAINPWTGDLCALWGCHRLSTPALRKSQAAIRRRFTREENRSSRSRVP
jgi:hypothetical protein